MAGERKAGRWNEEKEEEEEEQSHLLTQNFYLSPGFPTSSLMSSFHNFTQVQLSTQSTGQAFAKQGDGQESTVGWVTVVGGVGNQPMGGKAQ